MEEILQKYWGNIDNLTKKQRELIKSLFSLADEVKIKEIQDNLKKNA